MRERFTEQDSLPQGVRLLEKGEGGLERFLLKPGAYQLNFAFRNFGEHEDGWHSRASENLMDHREPFVFDYEHPAVRRFTETLFREKEDFHKPGDVRALFIRFKQLIQSMGINEDEFNNSLSDVVTSGRGMCDAQSVLLGSLLARHTNLDAQAILGQYGQVQERVTHPFSHQWMRITDGVHIYLFDPMYEKFAAFEAYNDACYELGGSTAHFENLTPGCYPAAHLINSFGLSGGQWNYEELRAVPRYDGDGHDVYVENEQSLSVQLSNNMTFAFESGDTQVLDVHNGAVKTSEGDTAIYYPLLALHHLES